MWRQFLTSKLTNTTEWTSVTRYWMIMEKGWQVWSQAWEGLIKNSGWRVWTEWARKCSRNCCTVIRRGLVSFLSCLNLWRGLERMRIETEYWWCLGIWKKKRRARFDFEWKQHVIFIVREWVENEANMSKKWVKNKQKISQKYMPNLQFTYLENSSKHHVVYLFLQNKN